MTKCFMKWGGEESIVAAEHELGWNGWPGIEWPASVFFGALFAQCFYGDERSSTSWSKAMNGLWLKVLLLISRACYLDGLPVASVVRPLRWCLSRSRKHPPHQDDETKVNPIGRQRRTRSPDQDWPTTTQVIAIADTINDGVSVLAKAGRVVIAGPVRCSRLMTPVVQLTPQHDASTNRRLHRHGSTRMSSSVYLLWCSVQGRAYQSRRAIHGDP